MPQALEKLRTKTQHKPPDGGPRFPRAPKQTVKDHEQVLTAIILLIVITYWKAMPNEGLFLLASLSLIPFIFYYVDKWAKSRKVTNEAHAPLSNVEVSSPVRIAIRDSVNQQQRIAAGLEPNPRALIFDVGEAGKFFSTKSQHLYSTRRTFKLKIENADIRTLGQRSFMEGLHCCPAI